LRRSHFDHLQPVCPRCLLESRTAGALVLASVYSESDAGIRSGILHCPNDECRQEYPIIDGIPIIVPDVRTYLANNQQHLLRRQDLPADLNGLLGDAIGPGTEFDTTRQHLSIYCWGHYADLDPDEHDEPGALASLLRESWTLSADAMAPALDLGCSVGRSTFELAARTGGLALGMDLNFAMLRVGQEILETGRLCYDRRRIGVVYDERNFVVELPAAQYVDFWACDVLALPLAASTFSTVLALNLFDCVGSPRDLLAVIGGMLKPGGDAVLATPYDWSPTATPAESWIGGHSQRGPNAGAAEPLLRALLTERAHPQSIDGLELTAEIEAAQWRTRLHDRSTVHYQSHVFALRKR
jgi:SAM-dependent methyltransferase/uncharacterized protein YbaR (Trm112 family)